MILGKNGTSKNGTSKNGTGKNSTSNKGTIGIARRNGTLMLNFPKPQTQIPIPKPKL